MKMPELKIGKRRIGSDHAPFVIAEIGINHEGSMAKAKKMIDDAAAAGAECVKFQSHVIADEMVPEAQRVIPGNAKESIYEIMARCALSESEEIELKKYTEEKGMIYLCTPFSRAAADRLHRMNVLAYKIGSGECNNYPLIKYIASFGKPVLLSTGMNDLESIRPAVEILREAKISYALFHCTNQYPTPYRDVRLGCISELFKEFPDAVIGLSDHSMGNYTCFGATALGASVLEKHFTSSKQWKGPDVPISLGPKDLSDLIVGTKAIWEASGGKKGATKGEAQTIKFAYASVVSIAPIKKGELLSERNIWVKRPGTGDFLAKDYESLLGKIACRDIKQNKLIQRRDVEIYEKK